MHSTKYKLKKHTQVKEEILQTMEEDKIKWKMRPQKMGKISRNFLKNCKGTPPPKDEKSIKEIVNLQCTRNSDENPMLKTETGQKIMQWKMCFNYYNACNALYITDLESIQGDGVKP